MAGSVSDEWMYNEVLDEVDDLAVSHDRSGPYPHDFSRRETLSGAT